LFADQKFEENLNCSKKVVSAAFRILGSMEFAWTVLQNDGSMNLPLKPMNYTNWKINEPSPASRHSSNNCVALSSLDDYKWSAVNCRDVYCYVCKRLGNVIAHMFLDASSVSVQKATQSVIRVCLSVC